MVFRLKVLGYRLAPRCQPAWLSADLLKGINRHAQFVPDLFHLLPVLLLRLNHLLFAFRELLEEVIEISLRKHPGEKLFLGPRQPGRFARKHLLMKCFGKLERDFDGVVGHRHYGLGFGWDAPASLNASSSIRFTSCSLLRVGASVAGAADTGMSPVDG